MMSPTFCDICILVAKEQLGPDAPERKVLEGGCSFQHGQYGATSQPSGDTSLEPVPAQQLPGSPHRWDPSGVKHIDHPTAERVVLATSQPTLAPIDLSVKYIYAQGLV